ncbi:MAG: hypothetical protein ACFBZ9_10545 [Sphingomonadales bacterium]
MTDEAARRVDAEIAKLIAETARINAETDKIRLEKAFYPMVEASGATLALIGIVKLFL